MKKILSRFFKRDKQIENESTKPIEPPRRCMVEHFGQKAHCLTVNPGMAVRESDKHIWVVVYGDPEEYERSNVWFIKKQPSLFDDLPNVEYEHANGLPAPEGHWAYTSGK